MKYKSVNAGYGYAAVMESGESLRESINKLATSAGVEGAYFFAIGALEDVNLGYYDLENRKYVYTKHKGMWELASLQGNISLYEGKPTIHMHAVLRDTTGTVVAGHLDDAKVAITVEVFVHLLDGATVERKLNKEIGLPLWELK